MAILAGGSSSISERSLSSPEPITSTFCGSILFVSILCLHVWWWFVNVPPIPEGSSKCPFAGPHHCWSPRVKSKPNAQCKEHNSLILTDTRLLASWLLENWLSLFHVQRLFPAHYRKGKSMPQISWTGWIIDFYCYGHSESWDRIWTASRPTSFWRLSCSLAYIHTSYVQTALAQTTWIDVWVLQRSWEQLQTYYFSWQLDLWPGCPAE